eukprot:1295735-Amphidinium_carterae.2
MNKRLRRLKWLGGGVAKTKSAKNTARASPVAAGLYGVSSQGSAPGQLHARRCKLVQTLVKCPKTASQGVIGILHPDVYDADYAHDLHQRTLIMWKLLCSCETTSCYRVSAALVTQGHRILRASSPWAAATGPASAMLLLALRLGFELTVEGKLKVAGKLTDLDLAALGHQEVKAIARRLTDCWTVKESAKGQATLGDGASVCRAFSAELPPFERSIIVNVWAGANWTMEKLFAKGLTDSDRCIVCGDLGSQAHRLADCPAGSQQRIAHLGNKGRRVLRELIAEPEASIERLLPPSHWFQVDEVLPGSWVTNERSAALCSAVFTDGSAEHPQVEVLRRAAWAAVCDTGQGTWDTPEYRQTVFEGELLGVIRATQHTVGPCVIWYDNKAVVQGAAKERHPELWDILERVIRPGLEVRKVKAHLKEPGRDSAEWYMWDGNNRADQEAGRALTCKATLCLRDKCCRKESRPLEGLKELWKLHIAITLKQSEDEGRDFPVEAILPKEERKIEGLVEASLVRAMLLEASDVLTMD